ncbi:MAG: hypothetical protein ACKVOU_14620 [Cytophagales bacterium]
MAKNQSTNKQVPKPTTPSKKIDDKHIVFNVKVLWTILGLVFILFVFSIFKNIQYPLFWADESMTVVGAQRVLEFGYPKVHDGKNVFYDLRHSNPKLGIDEATDAYVGGTSWGHYYFATIGVKLAEGFNDIYTKTGIIRSTFAFIGIAGLGLFVYFVSFLFKKIEHKLLFAITFFFLSLFSVSLALLLREARYYSISIFLFSLITGIYIKHRFAGGLNLISLRISLFGLLWLLFMTFAPAFFIVLVIIAISETAIGLKELIETKDLLVVAKKIEPIFSASLVSLIFIYPFLSYFKTFEISEAMAAFNGYGKKMYWDNISTILKYFKNFELLWLAVILKIYLLFNFKSVSKFNGRYLVVSLFSALIFVVYLFLIGRVPNFIYTRYIILLQPIVVFSIAFDALAIVLAGGNEGNLVVNFRSISVAIIILVLLCVNISGNSKFLKGHLTELANQYKGPLDYTIPAIKAKYPNTENLVVAANYEETSYMYYLGCKVVVGFIGNNLGEDANASPDVLAYRKPWGNYIEVFQEFMKKSPYLPERYPIYDNPVNNIPELNFLPAFNHKFETVQPNTEQDKTDLYFIR